MEDFKAEFMLKPSYPDAITRTRSISSKLNKWKKLIDTGEPVHTWNVLQKLKICHLYKTSELKMLLYRSDNDSFSFIKRLTVLLSIIVSTYTLSLILYGLPRFSLSDGFSYYGHFHMYGVVFLNGIVSSVISFAVNMGIIMLFR